MMGMNTKAAHDAWVDLHVSSEGYKHTWVNQTLRSSRWLLFFLNDCKDLENPWCRFNLQIFRKEMTLFLDDRTRQYKQTQHHFSRQWKSGCYCLNKNGKLLKWKVTAILKNRQLKRMKG